ncbi:MAG: nucleotidyltransferase domain-containing protein, partial [Candidatus Omnitrophota bacterium]
TKREDEILEGIIDILKTYLKPSRVILFGSRAKGKGNKSCDFDIAVDCKKPEISIQRKINDAIEKISGLYKIDIVYLQSVEDKFKDIILKTGKEIYERRT